MQSLVPIASILVSEQFDTFASKMAEALLKLSEQSVRSGEATLGFGAYNHLRANVRMFQKAVTDRLEELLLKEIRLAERTGGAPDLQHDVDLSLVTFEEMENKVLLGNISQTIEPTMGDEQTGLNLRIGHLLEREDLVTAANPFRPQIFVQAAYEGWCKLGADAESHRVVLRLLGPERFFQMASIFQVLNESLIDQGVLPNLAEAYRLKKSQNKVGLPPAKVARHEQDHYNKVRDLLLSTPKGKKSGNDEDLNIPDLFASGTTGENQLSPNTISVKVGPRLFGHLTKLQQQVDDLAQAGLELEIPKSATTLRKVKDTVPEGTLTVVDENTIELLAKIFDFVFLQKTIPDAMKTLIGQLQIPMLKAALNDKKFFIKEDHPARRLLDTIAKTSAAWDQQKGRDDPLYKMIEQIVERVQKDFDQQMGLFTDVIANLETFLDEEEKSAESILAEPIAEAMRQERMRLAQEAAEYDVELRIETGEVAGFVEVFLETQWTRILTLGHSVADQKPEVLVKARKVMDDLIWSVKPKNSPEDRKELITKLPSILSMVNAWLNAIKWNDPERVEFFSALAERHAAIVRIQSELLPRHQLEQAVNVAQKASERRLTKNAREQQVRPIDEFVHMVNDLGVGEWVEFARANGSSVKFKLSWVSPRRTRFIFTNRQGHEPSAFSADELAYAFRNKKAKLVLIESVVDRALSAVLDDAA